MSETTVTPPPVTDPPPTETVTSAPPPAPTAVTSHSDNGNDPERINRMEGALTSLSETVAGLAETVGKIVDSTVTTDSTPTHKPWTHWGSK